MDQKLSILICDDEVLLLEALRFRLSPYYDVHISTSVENVEVMLDTIQFDIAILDINLSNGQKTGADLQDIFSRRSPHTSIIIHSGDNDLERILPVTQRKYAAFLLKSKDTFKDILATLQRIEKIKVSEKILNQEKIVSFSPAMKEVIKQIDLIIEKNNPEPILILGETGVGKEYIVQYFAHKSKIKNLVSENMVNVTESIAESKLFGHVKGAFTGAIDHSTGLFEQANGGILFMDEIGDTKPSVQAKILRAINEKEIIKVGENKPRKIDVRFISATHRNLQEMIKENTFREDLFFRLNAFQITIPPLRERKEDILGIANHFLEKLNSRKKNNEQYVFDTDAEEAFLSYNWPGNIRELKYFISILDVRLPYKFLITKDDLLSIINELVKKNNSPIKPEENINGKLEKMKSVIEKALFEHRGNINKAATALKINRATLYRKIKACKIQLFNFEPAQIQH